MLLAKLAAIDAEKAAEQRKQDKQDEEQREQQRKIDDANRRQAAQLKAIKDREDSWPQLKKVVAVGQYVTCSSFAPDAAKVDLYIYDATGLGLEV